MATWTPYNTDSGLSTGTYRATFSYPELITPPSIQTPKSLTIAGYSASLTTYTIDAVNRKVNVEFSIFTPPSVAGQDSPAFAPLVIPVGAVLIAIAAVIGLGIIYLTLDKVEKLADTPAVQNFSYVLLIGAAFLVWRFFRGR